MYLYIVLLKPKADCMSLMVALCYVSSTISSLFRVSRQQVSQAIN